MAVTNKKLSVAAYQENKRKLKSTLRQNISEFLQNSTIHGLRYTNQPDLSIFERAYFIMNCMIVFGVSAFFVVLVAEKWSQSPTIISINTVPRIVTDYAFPAVTICNMNQALKSKVSNFSKFSKEYSFVKLLCKMEPNMTVLDGVKDWNSINDFILNTSQSCERMLLKCSFGGVEYHCTELFHPVIMDEGFCCAFNTLDPVYKYSNISTSINYNKAYPPNVKPVDWSLESGYQEPLPKYYSPMRAIGFGQTLGLNIILNVERDEYYCASGKSVGFKVTIHNPGDEPNIHETGLLLAPGLESFVRIIPTHLEADRKLRGLSRQLRNCVFESELKLSVFSHYSYVNCMYECRTKTTLAVCGCVASHMVTENSSLRICGYKDFQCVQEIKYLLKNKRFDIPCGQRCWSNCFSKKFKTDIFSANLKKSLMEKTHTLVANMSDTYVKENIAIANFYHKRYSYETTKQSPYIDSIDVLSSIGGLIGVFMGLSFISFAEIIYFLCIRSWRKNSERKTDGAWRR